MMLSILSVIHGRIGRFDGAVRLLRALRLRGLKRLWLATTVLHRERLGRDDVTVLIGVRNRADHRLRNALSSLRAQTYPAELTRIVVIDYGSADDHSSETQRLCAQFAADYVRVDGVSIWSRSRCLNVGIRRARTKFLMTSDVDVVLSKDYLADAVRSLKRSELSVICAPMLDLPADSDASFRRIARHEEPLALEAWKARAHARFDWPFHPSVVVTYSAFLRMIRGFDEYYELWGAEDADLLRRLTYLGLQARTHGADSFYLHQWHPKFEDVPGGKHAPHIRANNAHLARHHTILRNDPRWGSGASGNRGSSDR